MRTDVHIFFCVSFIIVRRAIKLNFDIKILSILLLLILISQGSILGNTNKKIKVKSKINPNTEIKNDSKLNIEVISNKQLEKIDITTLTNTEIIDLVVSTNSALSIQLTPNNDEDNVSFIPQINSFFTKTVVNPLKYVRFTSLFGMRNHPVLKKSKQHNGIDLKASINTDVFAFTEGIVTFVGKMKGYGNLVIISHKNGYETRYAHLNKINVKKNQKIGPGEKIASSGKSGIVSGPNLHFEIRKNNTVLNPLDYLKL